MFTRYQTGRQAKALGYGYEACLRRLPDARCDIQAAQAAFVTAAERFSATGQQ